MIIPTADNVKTVTDFRENLMGVLASLRKNPGPQFIFYKSKPAAILLSPQEYQRLLELVEDYEDAAEASEIIGEAKNRKERLYPFEEVAKLVGYKRGK